MKYTLYIALGLSILTFSCVTVEKINLDGIALNSIVDSTNVETNDQEVKTIVSKPALTWNQGRLNYDYKSVTSSIQVQNGDVDVVTVEGGKKQIVSQKFDALDFRGALAIKMKAKAEGTPELQLMLVDKDGYQTNTIKLANTIQNGDAYQTYYFDLNGAYSQSYPEMKDVDAKNITGLNLRVNKSYTGSIDIQSVEVILSNEIIKQKRNVPVGQDGGVLVDFTKEPESMVISKGITSSVSDGVLILDAKSVGALYERAELNVINTSLSKKQKVKAKIKVEGEASAFIRIDLIDGNGIITNKRPIIKEVKPGDWQEVEFDFEGRLAQSYPQQVDVDASRIQNLTFYINPGDNTFTGKVSIDEIVVK